MTYRSRNAKDKSGAYLFLPGGPATPHVSSDHRSLIRHIQGHISSEIQVVLPNLLHRYFDHMRYFFLDLATSLEFLCGFSLQVFAELYFSFKPKQKMFSLIARLIHIYFCFFLLECFEGPTILFKSLPPLVRL